MSYIPSPMQAEELLKQYNREPFHIQHAETVSKVMGEFAKEYDPDRVDFWRTVGMLHDIDFEQWPDQHCAKADTLLHELAIDEDVIHAVVSHGYGICYDVEPTAYMEKVLFADRYFGHGTEVRDEEVQGQKVRSRLLARGDPTRRRNAGNGASGTDWEDH